MTSNIPSNRGHSMILCFTFLAIRMFSLIFSLPALSVREAENRFFHSTSMLNIYMTHFWLLVKDKTETFFSLNRLQKNIYQVFFNLSYLDQAKDEMAYDLQRRKYLLELTCSIFPISGNPFF